jgi:hypothetical protein
MKKLALPLAGVAALLALSVDAPAHREPVELELACKPRGTTCHTSFECCSQNCQRVNGKDTCH